MHVENITSNAMSLDRNGQSMLIQVYEKEIDRLNNIINRIDNFVDRTIEVIKHQPTGNDEWILERLNGIKYLKELKEE